jgi:N-acetyl-anhydromuramyl-L-alanine amidase AmpD
MAPEFTEIDRMGKSYSGRGGARVTNFLLHTQEGNGTAESLAAYLNNPANGVSYHYTIDNSVVVCDVVNTDYASWSVLDANPYTINLCFAGSRAGWSRQQWLDNMGDAIDVAAYLAVQDCRKYKFDTTVIAPPYWYADGISDHRYVTDELGIGTHTDVGPGFPWDVFANAVEKYTKGEDNEMASAEEIAKAVWEMKVAKPDGTAEQAGILLGWVDQHTGDALDQLAGTGSKDQRTGSKAPLKPTGWAQLADAERATPAKPSLVDGVATRADLAALRDELVALIQGLGK